MTDETAVKHIPPSRKGRRPKRSANLPAGVFVKRRAMGYADTIRPIRTPFTPNVRL